MRRSTPAALEKAVFGLAALLLLVLAFALGQRLLDGRGGRTAAAPSSPPSASNPPPGATGTETGVSDLAPIRASGAVRVSRRRSAPPPPAK